MENKMQLYIHVDRAGSLREGTVIQNQKYPRGNSISILGSLADKEFSEHIEKLYSESISYHGYNYLVGITMPNNPIPYVQWAMEMYFEYIRFKDYPDMPSRFKSVFGWNELTDALDFVNNSNQKYSIFEVENDGDFFIADMNLLKLNFDNEVQKQNAHNYWQGKPLDGSLSYKPRWEYLIKTPVKVLHRIIN